MLRWFVQKECVCKTPDFIFKSESYLHLLYGDWTFFPRMFCGSKLQDEPTYNICPDEINMWTCIHTYYTFHPGYFFEHLQKFLAHVM